ncbi:tail assembly protein, partial [Acinetobacter baumannii]|nr:tail assembly protein [Acinetobacter baumannii]
IGEEQLDMSTEADIIHIVPRVIGAGGNNGVLQIVLGVVMMVAGYFTFGATTTTGMALIGAGAGMAMGGVASMLMPKVQSTQNQNQDGNRANFGFGSAVTTAAQGYPVPILYGRREVGGFVFSAGQYPEDQM